jgi:hypothetical protein
MNTPGAAVEPEREVALQLEDLDRRIAQPEHEAGEHPAHGRALVAAAHRMQRARHAPATGEQHQGVAGAGQQREPLGAGLEGFGMVGAGDEEDREQQRELGDLAEDAHPHRLAAGDAPGARLCRKGGGSRIGGW